MRNYRLKASFILDGLASFTIIIIITTLIVPFVQQLNQSYRNQLEKLDDKKIILVAVSHYRSEQLKKGVSIGVHQIIQQGNQVCTTKYATHETTCIKF
ncbi:hypothetical protein J3T65_01930 [Staphylococcus simiae]|uniref:hypothetical protein n=1 Tax=Staphylococcus simiae TaxID=308354 RepID=UPI001A9733E7|nr:hypothetical protein [Staphylococcus simiae]MBO1197936.1 hypothetical protein [Staphylococcus simiae]MBO1200413.1 hypothetical protein [Staphylococcus simiae]MBO1202686.1 hypothetical protein [Staphylococcus simiae]MBO1209927.1 hypothetical protein [Staphylococcus simiae]MBO1228830.1 hypothetical protein [Staphylococcus simiae]